MTQEIKDKSPDKPWRGITGPTTQVGVLHREGHPDATITADGKWHCTDKRWEQTLNTGWGPDVRPDGPTVIPHALRALRQAEHELHAKAELSIDWEPLPEGVIS